MASYIGGVYTGGYTGPEATTRISSVAVDPYDWVDDYGNVPRHMGPRLGVDYGLDEFEFETYVRPPQVELPGTPLPQPAPIDPGGWTPPEIFGWQPPVIGGGLDLTPGPGTGLPWTDQSGGIDLTPGPRTGLPWVDPETGGLDLTPGPGTGIPGGDQARTAIDMAAMLPMLILMMAMKN